MSGKTSKNTYYEMKRAGRQFAIISFPNCPYEWYWFERGSEEGLYGPYDTKAEIVEEIEHMFPMKQLRKLHRALPPSDYLKRA